MSIEGQGHCLTLAQGRVHTKIQNGFLAHLSRRLRGELIVYRSSRRPSVRPLVRACVRVFTLSNMNISETNGSIATKFYLNHHWGGGLAA